MTLREEAQQALCVSAESFDDEAINEAMSALEPVIAKADLQRDVLEKGRDSLASALAEAEQERDRARLALQDTIDSVSFQAVEQAEHRAEAAEARAAALHTRLQALVTASRRVLLGTMSGDGGEAEWAQCAWCYAIWLVQESHNSDCVWNAANTLLRPAPSEGERT